MKLNVVYILYFLCNERKKKKKKQVSLVRGQVRGKKNKIKNKRLVLVVGRKGYITMDNSCCRPWNVSFPRCCCVCYLLLLPLSFLLPLATSKRRVCRYVFLLLPSTARVQKKPPSCLDKYIFAFVFSCLSPSTKTSSSSSSFSNCTIKYYTNSIAADSVQYRRLTARCRLCPPLSPSLRSISFQGVDQRQSLSFPRAFQNEYNNNQMIVFLNQKKIYKHIKGQRHDKRGRKEPQDNNIVHNKKQKKREANLITSLPVVRHGRLGMQLREGSPLRSPPSTAPPTLLPAYIVLMYGK